MYILINKYNDEITMSYYVKELQEPVKEISDKEKQDYMYKDIEENKEAMTEQLSVVTSGQITNAVRDTSIDGVDIKENDFMGIINGKILISLPDRKQATIDTIAKMVNDESEILTILVGEDVAIEEAEEIVSYVEEHFPDIEVELHEGLQPVYAYLLAVE